MSKNDGAKGDQVELLLEDLDGRFPTKIPWEMFAEDGSKKVEYRVLLPTGVRGLGIGKHVGAMPPPFDGSIGVYHIRSRTKIAVSCCIDHAMELVDAVADLDWTIDDPEPNREPAQARWEARRIGERTDGL